MPTFDEQPSTHRGKVIDVHFAAADYSPQIIEIKPDSPPGRTVSTENTGVNIYAILDKGLIWGDEVHWTTHQTADGSVHIKELSCDRIGYYEICENSDTHNPHVGHGGSSSQPRDLDKHLESYESVPEGGYESCEN